MKIVTSINLTDKEPIKTDGYICLELNAILKAVCYTNNVDIYDVKGKRRFGELVSARREYCYLACKLTHLTERNPQGNSLGRIGNEINQSHSNVLCHHKVIKDWLDIPSYGIRKKIEQIEKQL